MNLREERILLCILTFILSAITKGLAVRCFICSYSPDDKNNRTDVCTEDKFQPTAINIYDCPIGCKIYVQWDLNDELEQWRRNCAQEDDEITNDCAMSFTAGWRAKSCLCDRDYCNKAAWYSDSASLLSTTLTLLFGLLLLRGHLEHF